VPVQQEVVPDTTTEHLEGSRSNSGRKQQEERSSVIHQGVGGKVIEPFHHLLVTPTATIAQKLTLNPERTVRGVLCWSCQEDYSLCLCHSLCHRHGHH
jgi:hypothetical protein